MLLLVLLGFLFLVLIQCIYLGVLDSAQQVLDQLVRCGFVCDCGVTARDRAVNVYVHVSYSHPQIIYITSEKFRALLN